MNLSKKFEELGFKVTAVSSIKNKYDTAIIATNSDVRFTVLSQLMKFKVYYPM